MFPGKLDVRILNESKLPSAPFVAFTEARKTQYFQEKVYGCNDDTGLVSWSSSPTDIEHCQDICEWFKLGGEVETMLDEGVRVSFHGFENEIKISSHSL